MMSFEDWQSVDMDWTNKTITIIENSGRTREYKMRNQPDLVKLAEWGYDRGEIEIRDIGTRTKPHDSWDFSELEQEEINDNDDFSW